MALLKGIELASEYATRSWAIFHDRCIGKDFEEIKTGKIRNKGWLYSKYLGTEKENWHIFDRLINDRHSEYRKVDKVDYRDGNHVGILEGRSMLNEKCKWNKKNKL